MIHFIDIFTRYDSTRELYGYIVQEIHEYTYSAVRVMYMYVRVHEYSDVQAQCCNFKILSIIRVIQIF